MPHACLALLVAGLERLSIDVTAAADAKARFLPRRPLCACEANPASPPYPLLAARLPGPHIDTSPVIHLDLSRLRNLGTSSPTRPPLVHAALPGVSGS
ncbi:hypothetical protein TOPH_01651 [Tolypocladium ophioglossoides CBS 100239]|uniref:Secreted protein n=1 Tax=Tolypocladium ophioglossoides (strain CBS 100239) TaxID=1163406 RepID=A0A0L0NI62_TOLOC|nr:hypothetical protein TOPH_01651 [Tolypocladium ophioglossoides CBS 100239]